MVENARSPWIAVCDALRRRRGMRLALVCLALIHAAVIYAPLVANDRPYVVEAVDFQAYDDAREELVDIARRFATLAEQGRHEFEAELHERAVVRDYTVAIAAERGALLQRSRTMRTYLAPGAETLLLRLEQECDRTLSSVRAGRALSAEQAGREVLSLARASSDQLRPRREGVLDHATIDLVGARSYPLLEGLSSSEVFFMTTWLFVLTAPLWRPRRRPGIKLAGLALVGLAVAVAWPRVFPDDGRALSLSPKHGLSAGEVVATRVVFPPFAMGFAETHQAESFRPPTWHASAELSGDGSYVRGARSPGARPEGQLAPVADPPSVRYGEFGLNHALRHPLGTDALGRDLFVRILWGGRISLLVGLSSALLLVAIGVLVGACAGYYGGWCDALLSRCIEVVQCFPAFFLIVTAVALIPSSTLHPLFAVVLVIGLVGWTGVARLVRAEFLRERELEYVLAARALGFSGVRTMFLHVLPNVMGPVLVAATFAVASGILVESGVSFLGFGVQDPVPSWGALINESRSLEHWWMLLFPGLVIFATVLSTHVLGDGLREVLDPRLASLLDTPGDRPGGQRG